MTNYLLISKLKRSNIKIIILELAQNPKTVMNIAKITDKHKTAISRAIQDMLKDKLIVCKNPEAHNFRYYETTNLGKQILLEIKKLK